MKLAEIASKLGCPLEGNPDAEITGVSGMEHAGPSELTFLSNPRYARKLKGTRAGAVIAAPGVDAGRPDLPVLRSANPYLTFAHALELFYQPPAPAAGIHPSAVIAMSARIGENATIGPFVFIDEEVDIGENAVIRSHVSIYRGATIGDDFHAHSHAVVREYCRVGNRVVLQNGAIIGADGYGFARRDDGSHYKIVQSGIVVVEDDVEIQAHACIDRATVGETRIRRGAKIDNLVQVGHASVVGEDALLCAQAGVAGSTELGKGVLLAGQAGVAGHCKLGDGVIITAQSGVHGDIEAGKMLSGSPGFDNRQWLRSVAAFPRLPELLQTVRELQSEIARLKKDRAASADGQD